MAAAAALRHGELSEAELKAAITSLSKFQLGRTLFLKNFPADKYIISVKGKITKSGMFDTGWV